MSDIEEMTEQLESLAANERGMGHFADARFTTDVKDGLTAQAATIERLREALKRIATPAAFWVATSDVNPECLARMVYAQCIHDGGTAEDAESLATVRAQERGEDDILRILRRKGEKP